MPSRLKPLLLALLLCLWPCWGWAQAAASPLRIAYLFSDGDAAGVLEAHQRLLLKRPDLRDHVKLQLLSESTFDDADPKALASSQVLVYDVMNQQLVQRFNARHGLDLLALVSARGTVLGVGEGVQNQEQLEKEGVLWDARARAYWSHGGPHNRLALLESALQRAGATGIELPEPQRSLDQGYYYPDGAGGRVFADWAGFDAWRKAQGKTRPHAARVALGFYKASYYGGDTALVDALIAAIERRGAEAIPVFGYPGAMAFEALLGSGEAVRADVGLGLFFQFNDSQSAAILQRVGIPVINLVSLYGRSAKDWQASATGLSTFEGTFNLAGPELAGTTAPTVVGSQERVRDPVSGLGSVLTRPIAERVDMAVSRALRYAELRQKPNAEKRLALMYYNYPAGKAGISASYLNVAESLVNVLRRLQAEGYDLGGPVPTPEALLQDMVAKARNVASYAPGELRELIDQGEVRRIELQHYERWLSQLDPTLQQRIQQDWGKPADGKLMTERIDGHAHLAIPALRFGKLLLLPQPSRGWGEDHAKLHHAMKLAPSHQYVATYAWLRHGFQADAIVHVGTHGTLEWLDGRGAGLGPDDASDALIGDLPNAYLYSVDVVGEGLVARRRSMATLVDHMVPPFVQSELTQELARVGELLNEHIKNEGKNPDLAAIYARQTREAAVRLGLAKDLGLDPQRPWSDEELHTVEDYLLELKSQTVPYGLHAFGRVPTGEAIDSTVQAIVAVDRSALPEAGEVMAQEMRERIADSGPRELDSLMTLLAGGFVPAGKGGEPIRNPDAYPTGANFYGIDPDKVPKPASWEMGVVLANQLIDEHTASHGSYPSKVSFVIWGDETMRHEGVLESQIFHLLGTRPVWDARGRVVDVEVVPREQLKRPRVDIVIASTASGLFANLTQLLDKAVQQVKALDEPGNQVRENYLAIKQLLMARGVDEAQADRLAGVRIFDEPPGQFNLNTSEIVSASGSWDSDASFANEYIRKMGHGYGNGFWGQPMPDVFKLVLSGTQKVVHSSSTTLYGALDNDDMYMYMGGLAAAVRSLDGRTPELLITDTRDPGQAGMTGINRFVAKEFRSRYVNPQWIQGMQKEGYAGAGAMREFVEYLWGWDATAGEVVDDAMWKETFDTYVQDKFGLGMGAFFESRSPFAYQDMTVRMIETIRKGHWQADAAVRSKLVREYLGNVARHGVNCTHVSCGNGRLLRFVMEEGALAGVPAEQLAQLRQAFERALGRTVEAAAEELDSFVAGNEASALAERAANQALVAQLPVAVPFAAGSLPAAAPKPPPPAVAAPRAAAGASPPAAPQPPVAAPPPPEFEGRLMLQEDRSPRQPQPAPQPPAVLGKTQLAVGVALLLFLLLALRLWERHEGQAQAARFAPAKGRSSAA